MNNKFSCLTENNLNICNETKTIQPVIIYLYTTNQELNLLLSSCTDTDYKASRSLIYLLKYKSKLLLQLLFHIAGWCFIFREKFVSWTYTFQYINVFRGFSVSPDVFTVQQNKPCHIVSNINIEDVFVYLSIIRPFSKCLSL